MTSSSRACDMHVVPLVRHVALLALIVMSVVVLVPASCSRLLMEAELVEQAQEANVVLARFIGSTVSARLRSEAGAIDAIGDPDQAERRAAFTDRSIRPMIAGTPVTFAAIYDAAGSLRYATERE